MLTCPGEHNESVGVLASAFAVPTSAPPPSNYVERINDAGHAMLRVIGDVVVKNVANESEWFIMSERLCSALTAANSHASMDSVV